MESLTEQDRLVAAIDFTKTYDNISHIYALRDTVGMMKVGYAFGLRYGWKEAVQLVHRQRRPVLEDLKLKDVPATMAMGVQAVVEVHAPEFFTVHGDVTLESLATVAANKGRAKVLGVTVLSSMTEADCQIIYNDSVARKTLQFGRNVAWAGLDGLVCSPLELPALSEDPDTTSLTKFVVGIRPEWAKPLGQARYATPRQAILEGADYLIAGSPLTPAGYGKQFDSPAEAAEAIVQEMKAAS